MLCLLQLVSLLHAGAPYHHLVVRHAPQYVALQADVVASNTGLSAKDAGQLASEIAITTRHGISPAAIPRFVQPAGDKRVTADQSIDIAARSCADNTCAEETAVKVLHCLVYE